MIPTKQLIETTFWRLEITNDLNLGKTICIPTIHPVGDQRVIRCVQAALDIGYGVHIIWLGGKPGNYQHHPMLHETRLPQARSFKDRAKALFRVTKLAWKLNADMWHIHDFYMLPFAYAWALRVKKPVIYDVHEYYPEYYARRNSIPKWLQPQLEKMLTIGEKCLAAKLSGVNTANYAITQKFLAANISTITTENFPSSNFFSKHSRLLTPNLLLRVVHIGSLNATYGAETIIQAAVELLQIAPKVEMIIIGRFHSDANKLHFNSLFKQYGSPANLKLLDPIPAHKIPELLASCGIGISAVQNIGQAPFTVHTKLYEYAIMGLAIIGPDLPATRNFVETSAVGTLVAKNSGVAFAKAIVATINNAEKICAAVNEKAALAKETLSWEKVCGPRLQSLIRKLDNQG